MIAIADDCGILCYLPSNYDLHKNNPPGVVRVYSSSY